MPTGSQAIGAAGNVRVLTNAAVDGGAEQQILTLADSTGKVLGDAASPLPVTNPNATASGTISATDAVVAAPGGAGALLSGTSTAASYVSMAVPAGHCDSVFQFTGTFGGGTLYTEMSVDSTNGINGNWIAMQERQTGVLNTNIGYGFTVAGYYRGNISGASWIRARVVGATAPSIAVVLVTSSATGATFQNASLPTGNNTIGTILERASDLALTAVGAAGAAVTLTLPAPAAGLFHYITSLTIQRYASAALTGAAAPIVVTSTNLPGAAAWSFDTAGAIGVSQVQQVSMTAPLKSSAAATATTIAAPIATGVIWRISATYYTA